MYFVIDAALLFGFYLIGLTGLVISTWLGLQLGNYAAWRALHVWASIVTLALVVVKIGLHAGWIMATARRYFGRQATNRRILPRSQPGLDQTQLVVVPARPATAAGRNGRRDFLVLMGVVGAASLLSAIGALHDPAAAAEAADSDESSALAVEGAAPSWAVQSGSLSSSACMVQCNRRCSYPGHCRSYQDSNGNGRCDWGECA